jgi:hypothetical protein
MSLQVLVSNDVFESVAKQPELGEVNRAVLVEQAERGLSCHNLIDGIDEREEKNMKLVLPHLALGKKRMTHAQPIQGWAFSTHTRMNRHYRNRIR